MMFLASENLYLGKTSPRLFLEINLNNHLKIFQTMNGNDIILREVGVFKPLLIDLKVGYFQKRTFSFFKKMLFVLFEATGSRM